jgi:hypothetical protein
MDSSSLWWQIDRSLPQPVGATPLLDICVETYGWKEDKARRVLTGYRQFLDLKKKLGDFDGKNPILEPSNLIDQMWVQHIGTRSYTEDCKLLCGEVVRRDGYTRLNHDARAKRMETTHRILNKAKFMDDPIDEEVWCLRERSHSLVLLSEEEEEQTTVIFRPHLSSDLKEARYEMPLYENFVVTACVYAEDQGMEYRDLSFLVDGKHVSPDLTLKELGFAHSQVIDVVPK